MFFIDRYPEMLQIDNGKEFTNSKLKSNIEGIGVGHIFWESYHFKIQGEIEALNKTIERAFSDAYDNVIQIQYEWDLELNLFKFLHYYNCYKKYTTTGEVSKFFMNNFNDSIVK